MIRGHYHDARQARPVEATLCVAADGRWQFVAEGAVFVVDPREVRVSDRIGQIPRRLHLPGGAEFETPDNDGIDALVHVPGEGPRGGFVHALERRWPVAVASLLGIVALSVLMLTHGLPVLAGWAAHRVPPAADRAIGGQVLEVLDRTMLEPTRLDEYQRRRMYRLFNQVTGPLDDGHAYSLRLRDARLGANALALPSGIIVFTDDLVELAEHDAELMAVMAHEVGHVRGRDSLRLLIQNAGVSALAVVLLGDVGTVSAALAAAGPMLMQLRYTRDIERQADAFARDWLAAQDIDPAHFDRILCRMVAESKGREPPLFLSSHPPSSERVRCEP